MKAGRGSVEQSEVHITDMKWKRGRAAYGAVLLVAALLLAACGTSPSSSPGTGATAQSSGGTLTVGWAEPPDTLNPATTGARDVGPIDENMFDTLIWLTPTMQVTPDLATSWKLSGDGKTYTFELRHDVKFHDGTPFDAAAVVANWQYITSPSTQSKVAVGLLGPCTAATATSQYEVTVQCSQPYAPLLAQVGEPYLGMQSPAAIQRYGAALGDHPVGTGPFEFVSYTPNVSVILKKNPDYRWAPPALHHNGPASLDSLVLHIVTSSQARVSELQSGQSQLIQETPGVFYKSLGQNPSFKDVPVPISGMGIFAPINASRWPTDDVNVRRAILYSIDKVGAIKVADDGVFPPSNSPLAKGTTGYDSAVTNMYPYNPGKAAQILSSDGWTKVDGIWTKGGRKLTLDLSAISSVPEYPLIAQAIQGYLKKAGMEVNVTQLAVPAWLAANIQGNMSLTPLQYVGVDPDALHFWFLPGQYFNWSHYSNPALSDLLLKAQGETNQGQRLKLYDQAQQIIMEQAVDMPIHENVDLLVMSSKLQGLTYAGGGFEFFYTASLH